jgi:hypothetical protein|tara:strand:+ start:2254 stop:2538 length:285 start_codon:yes stop_codon:yes gene_type:complete
MSQEKIEEIMAKYSPYKENSDNLKIFKLQFDTILITVIAENESDAINALIEYEDSDIFIDPDGQYQYDFGDDYIIPITITEVPLKRGLIQYESH